MKTALAILFNAFVLCAQIFYLGIFALITVIGAIAIWDIMLLSLIAIIKAITKPAPVKTPHTIEGHRAA